ncbi:MAG TPA: hypothetical protein VFE70_08530 [Candidatus Elarobacter sp.]|nr:hypothetical protein [Candidatus Elarobacter sp.]
MSKIKRAAALAALMLATAASACSGKQQTEAQSSPPPLAQPAATPAPVMPAAAPATVTASAVATTAAVAAGPATSDPAAGLTSSDGEQTGTRVIVNSLKRGPNMLTLRFTLRNDSSAPLETGGNHFGGGDYIDTRNVSGIFLTDAAAKKKYFVVADTDKHCLCSEHVDDVPAKAAVTLWAQFPAPPPNVQKITVTVPHFQPLDDVAISS